MTSPQGLWRRNAGGGGPAGLCSSCVCRHHIEVRVPQARRQGVGTPPHSRTSHPACTCLKRCPPPPCVPGPEMSLGTRQQEQGPNPSLVGRANTEGRQGTGHNRRGRLALVWDIWGWPDQHLSQPLGSLPTRSLLASRTLPSPGTWNWSTRAQTTRGAKQLLVGGKEQRPPRERTFRAADTLPGCAAALGSHSTWTNVGESWRRLTAPGPTGQDPATAPTPQGSDPALS